MKTPHYQFSTNQVKVYFLQYFAFLFSFKDISISLEDFILTLLIIKIILVRQCEKRLAGTQGRYGTSFEKFLLSYQNSSKCGIFHSSRILDTLAIHNCVGVSDLIF